jgi:exodeoxyribonuclease V alpha subunit
MSHLLPADPNRPELELLVRRWTLPEERRANVLELLAAHDTGGTACLLPSDAPTAPSGWGAAAQLLPKPGVGHSIPPTPLLLCRDGDVTYLQSWRFFQAENTIAVQLLARAFRPAPFLTKTVDELLALLGDKEVNVQQRKAIARALEKSMAIITGGPGTGKTHTLARLLALLLIDQPTARLIIRLAAPTGKAADRMRDAIKLAITGLGERFASIEGELSRTSTGACTLHTLLGFNPGTGRCRYNQETPLRCDVLIVDECSMVDTLLWQTLLTALPPTTRLILLGDPNQLESVEAGDVLGTLVRSDRDGHPSPLGPVWVELTESMRFHKRVAIGELATVIVRRNISEAKALLQRNRLMADLDLAPPHGLVWLGEHQNRFRWEALPNVVRQALAAVGSAETPEAGLAALDCVRVLTAQREHSMGAAGLNAAIHQQLEAKLGQPRKPNQPIIINRNDPETGLKNGSVGLIMDFNGARTAYFPDAAGGPKFTQFVISQLPDYSPAWAMTIHRSQGSEFKHVVVVLPIETSRLATCELVYTAITRAQECVYVWGSLATIENALDPRPRRGSLLEQRLRDPISSNRQNQMAPRLTTP